MEDRRDRKWILASLTLQFLGYVVDVVWHGLLNPGIEPTPAGVTSFRRELATLRQDG